MNPVLVSIHQPQYLPWLGFFEKLDRADVFVFLDDVQFAKNDWQNRNKIRTSQGWQWVTVPVLHRFGQKIREVETDSRVDWRKKHRRALEVSYRRAPHYDRYAPEIDRALGGSSSRLSDVCLESIAVLSVCLGIHTRAYVSSSLELPPAGPPVPTPERTKVAATQRLVDICRFVKADAYYSGPHGRHYLDVDLFRKNGIEVVFQEYRHPEYRQCFEPFIPNMSVVDLIFNAGPDALRILREGGGGCPDEYPDRGGASGR